MTWFEVMYLCCGIVGIVGFFLLLFLFATDRLQLWKRKDPFYTEEQRRHVWNLAIARAPVGQPMADSVKEAQQALEEFDKLNTKK